jgi:hypothetical protein
VRSFVQRAVIAPCIAAGLMAAGSATPAVAQGVSGPTGDHRGPARPTLVGWAQLPAASFLPGSEPSGSALGTEPINGITPPFDHQPIQGFSAVVRNRSGSFDALSDNGYGAKDNSADFLLRIHRIKPDFRSGRVNVMGGVTLSDPNGFTHFPLTRSDRILTGADFDPESIVRAPDDTYWIGEEFGPYLLHFDRSGQLLQRPVPVPGVKSKNSPDLEPGEEPNLGGSKGFENLAISNDGATLYPMLEGPVTGDNPQHLRLYEFDRRQAAFTRHWTYRLETPELAAADLTTIGKGRFLAIERDNLQGDEAAFKKVFVVDLADRDQDGGADKTEIVDLLNIANPDELGVPGKTFRFPFFTIETVTVLDDRTIGIINDNNFPFDAARTPGSADNNEFIAVRLAHSVTRAGAGPR